LASLRAASDQGLEATREMLATKGRASYLGERSIGHLDPGARSSQLLVHAVCGVLAAEPGHKGATSA
jgi:dihydroxyacetone kinase-like protein